MIHTDFFMSIYLTNVVDAQAEARTLNLVA